MISVRVTLVDFMDPVPIARARVTMTIDVLPRFRERLDLEGPPGLGPGLAGTDPNLGQLGIPGRPRPEVLLVPEWSLGATHQADATTAADGTVSATFNVGSDFTRLANAVLDGQQATDVVAVLTVRVRVPPIDREFRFHRGLVVPIGPNQPAPPVSDVLGPNSRTQRTIAIDFAKAIVGATTPNSTTIWFRLHGTPAAGEGYVCEIAEDALGSPARRLALTFDATRAMTAVARPTGLREGTTYRYGLRMNDATGSERVLARGSLTTPVASSRSLRFAFASCHLPTSNESMERWRTLAARDDYDFLLLTGDQVYGDGLDHFAGSDWLEQYISLYDRFWGEWPMRDVLRRTPTYMILDDHEVDDDWGVVEADTQEKRDRNRAGVTAYRIFQQAHNPGGFSGPLHYSFNWGPASFFMLDNRTARTLPENQAGVAHPVLGNTQFAALQAWARAPATRAADFAFVIAPVPIAFLPVEEVLRIIEEVREAAQNAGGIFGAIGGAIVGFVVAGPPGAVVGAAIGAGGGYYVGGEVADGKIEDAGLADLTTRDLADMWTAGDNQRDLRAVLDTLFDLGNDVGAATPRPRAMFLLGGDVHSGSMHLVRSRRTGGPAGTRHRRNPVAFQAISSAISQKPATDKIYERVVRHITNDVSITTSELIGAGFDFATLAESEFAEVNANFALDDRLGSNYAAEIVDFVAQRNFGIMRIEPVPGSGRRYDVYTWVEGRTKAIRRGFRLELDATPQVGVRDLYGGLAVAEGRVALLRAHERGTGYGPPADPLDADAVVTLDSDPTRAFGMQLRPGRDGVVSTAEFDALRSALRRGRRVRIEYIRTGYRNGMVHRVTELA